MQLGYFENVSVVIASSVKTAYIHYIPDSGICWKAECVMWLSSTLEAWHDYCVDFALQEEGAKFLLQMASLLIQIV